MKRTIFTMTALLLGAVAGCGSSSDKCGAVTCGSGEYCDGATGTCRTADMCMGITCGAGQVCDGATGKCSPIDRCAAVTCSGGQVCSAATGACANPAFPALGFQIDRMGRPAVNTALTNPFDFFAPGGAATPVETSDTTKARYNQDANAATWSTIWGSGADKTGRTGAIGLHQGILDGLDGTCGNAFGYGLGTALGFSKYGLLNFVLANDALHLDTTQVNATASSGYLAVEIGAASGVANTESGGRSLSQDVIDVTYSALVLNATSGGTDNIAQTSVPSGTFPFMLAAP